MTRRLVGLLLCVVVYFVAGVGTPCFAASANSYTLSAAFYRGILSSGGSQFGLSAAATISFPSGSYIYGSKAAFAAQPSLVGKPTVIGLWRQDGTQAAQTVFFPQSTFTADPLNKGAQSSIYNSTMTVLMPLDAALPAQELILGLSMLLCTSVNCTPVEATLPIRLPSIAEQERLPLVQMAPWPVHEEHPSSPSATVAALLRLEGGGVAPQGHAPQTTRVFGGGGAGISLAVQPDRLVAQENIKPVAYAPALEVSSLGKALLLGFLAGIILNCMPCVLPVIGLKLGAMLGHGNDGRSDEEQKRFFCRQQLFFAAGILVWFSVLTVIFAGFDLAWGQLFQSSAVVVALVLCLFLLALNLFGVFTLPMIDFRGGQAANPYMQSFVSGFTATFLATPCSGPLLGGVLGWALMQPVWVLAVSLFSVGLGMAAPYLVLAANPGFARYLPKSGPWTGLLEQGVAFLLLGTVVYLLTLLPGTGGVMFRMIISLLLTAIAAWLWGQIGGYSASTRRRGIARTLAVLLVGVACYFPFAPQSVGFAWQPYTQESFSASLGQKAMLVEFTADWCPTCKVMEATTLSSQRMDAWQKQYGFQAVRVDLTQDFPDGQALLRQMGSVSIPVIALFPAGKGAESPLVLRDVVTPGQLDDALQQAFGKAGTQ